MKKVTIDLPVDIHQKLKAKAKKSYVERTVTAQIRLAILDYLGKTTTLVAGK